MPQSARELLARLAPDFPTRHVGAIHTDTSQFMAIGYGDVIQLADRHFLVLRDEVERRFGLEDPKYWVKRCRCLETGERNILKLVFHESFPMGSFRCGWLECRFRPCGGSRYAAGSAASGVRATAARGGKRRDR